MSKGTIKLVANRVHALEVIPDVQNDFPRPGYFDQSDEVVELIVTSAGLGLLPQIPASSRSTAGARASLSGGPTSRK